MIHESVWLGQQETRFVKQFEGRKAGKAELNAAVAANLKELGHGG